MFGFVQFYTLLYDLIHFYTVLNTFIAISTFIWSWTLLYEEIAYKCTLGLKLEKTYKLSLDSFKSFHYIHILGF